MAKTTTPYIESLHSAVILLSDPDTIAETVPNIEYHGLAVVGASPLPGASPEDVEEALLEEVHEVLKYLPNLHSIHSVYLRSKGEPTRVDIEKLQELIHAEGFGGGCVHLHTEAGLRSFIEDGLELERDDSSPCSEEFVEELKKEVSDFLRQLFAEGNPEPGTQNPEPDNVVPFHEAGTQNPEPKTFYPGPNTPAPDSGSGSGSGSGDQGALSPERRIAALSGELAALSEDYQQLQAAHDRVVGVLASIAVGLKEVAAATEGVISECAD
jgi:hypothetical protein